MTCAHIEYDSVYYLRILVTSNLFLDVLLLQLFSRLPQLFSFGWKYEKIYFFFFFLIALGQYKFRYTNYICFFWNGLSNQLNITPIRWIRNLFSISLYFIFLIFSNHTILHLWCKHFSTKKQLNERSLCNSQNGIK